MRKMASIQQITSIEPIDGADRIEAIKVLGWTCVSGKGNFQTGDLCVYFEIDSALPLDRPQFAFLADHAKTYNGKQVHVLKTKRLRGIYSQGLCLPVRDFDEVMLLNRGLPLVGTDVSDLLGVEKYEPPIHASMGNLQPAGSFPTHLMRTTDASRCQNLTEIWDVLRALPDWLWTEKLDGTSMSVARDENGLVVCSRNLSLKDADNIYWRMARKYKLDELLKNVGEFVQGEIVGPGIQGNPLALKENAFYVFNWEVEGGCNGQVPLVPQLGVRNLPTTVAELLAEVDGMKSALNKDRLAEGVVLWNPDAKGFPVLNYRGNMKAISNKYLLKGDR